MSEVPDGIAGRASKGRVKVAVFDTIRIHGGAALAYSFGRA
jgi:hypothetical protein